MINFYDMHKEEMDEMVEHITNAVSRYLTERLGYEWQDGAPTIHLLAQPDDHLETTYIDDVLSSDSPMDELDSAIDLHVAWDARIAFTQNQFLDDFTEAFQALPEEVQEFWKNYTQFQTEEDPVSMTTLRDSYMDASGFTIDCDDIRQQVLQQPISISYDLQKDPSLLSIRAYEDDPDRTILLGIAGQQGVLDAVDKAFDRLEQGRKESIKDVQALPYVEALKAIREDFVSPVYHFQTVMPIENALQIACEKATSFSGERKPSILCVHADAIVSDASHRSRAIPIRIPLEKPMLLPLDDIEQSVSYEPPQQACEVPSLRKSTLHSLRQVQKLTEGKVVRFYDEAKQVAR